MTPAELAEMEALCFPEAFTTWSEADYATHIQNDTGILACNEAGFIVGYLVAGEAEIITLGVLPESRKQGHGTDLLMSFESKVRAKGAKEIFLEVSAENKAALVLYKNCDFASVGRRRKYYKNDEGIAVDAFILKKEF